MAIKQLWLFDPTESKHNLDHAQKLHDEKVPVAWGPPEMNESDLRRLDYINHLKHRLQHIETQEIELSKAIEEGWSVIAAYPMGEGMRGCHMVLYKNENTDQKELFDYSVARGRFGIPVPDSDKAV